MVEKSHDLRERTEKQRRLLRRGAASSKVVLGPTPVFSSIPRARQIDFDHCFLFADSSTEITAINVTTALTGVATSPIGLTCAACAGDGTKKVAFAPSGACRTVASRIGEQTIQLGLKTTQTGVTFSTAGTCNLCYSPNGVTWVEQTTAGVRVVVAG